VKIIKGKNPKKPYTVRYRDSFGKQREKSFGLRKEADEFIADETREKRYGRDVNLVAPKQSFNDAVRRYIDSAACFLSS
jgi:hypothetical protein